jgi:hypothetical protein
MAETKYIPVTTQVNLSTSSVSVYTFYDDLSVPYLVGALISDIVQTIDGVNFIEGELAIRFRYPNFASQTDCIINPAGELIVVSFDSAYPANIYNINDTSGELQITV